ncbi:PF06865 family protein [Leptospira fainei serovar Hurstbridge str. BUT 6]|uniref:Pyrimidine/purine nucleoside phosphorylase n=1 Tax=Leptospira fainei serovar Hurstbridge str. BUT 6 TaxID=1193011 RepID=S3VB94_9LEPT|nr:pyrimidine/purine nucleoside phosphorylase [Leptospira fainei]EPG73745.1 PF06865 family protein [Leptospira fainei serovar Hurstbridge str. BUT 6]
MQQFENVTVLKKANVYFNGQVTSRTLLFANGEKKTLGILMPGDYEFGTDDREIMEITEGDLQVLLPGNENWQEIKSGQSFQVPAKSKFKLKVKSVSDYCCSYFKE